MKLLAFSLFLASYIYIVRNIKKILWKKSWMCFFFQVFCFKRWVVQYLYTKINNIPKVKCNNFGCEECEIKYLEWVVWRDAGAGVEGHEGMVGCIGGGGRSEILIWIIHSFLHSSFIYANINSYKHFSPKYNLSTDTSSHRPTNKITTT